MECQPLSINKLKDAQGCQILGIFFRNNVGGSPTQERGTECGEHGEWGECYIPGNVAKHSGECPQTFWVMSPNIPGNVAKHSGECAQTFRGMSPNIPGNVLKHSGECPQTILGNVPKHSGECR